jgi:hypothetical protein
MTVVQTKIPDSILRQAKKFAERENISLEQVISLCLAHSLGVWTAESLVSERAKRASHERFLEFMSKVPDVEPEEHDRLD